MSQIKQLLRLHIQGKGKKEIASILGISKNTVKQYIISAEINKLGIEGLLNLGDPELEAQFHSGNPAYKDNRFEAMKDKLDYFFSELTKVGVNKRLLWEEYKAQHSHYYRYSQFCYHLSQHKIARNPSMVLQHQPGERLFVDFAGKKLSYVDCNTGEIIPCEVFVACLPYSDYCFAMAVRSQNVSDFLYALGRCLSFFGGVPKAIVPDNLKSAIIKANRYEPDINQGLEDFANHYETAIVPTRVAKPKDKALVENQVKLVYTRIYAKLRNEQFFDLVSLNEAIIEKVKAHNQTRMQQKPYCRQECFLAEEKPFLTSLPNEVFELKYYREVTVAKNNHILLTQDKHYYSVPYQYIGLKVKVIYTRSIVCIYSKGKQIANHPRSSQQGRYTTVKEHLCSAHQHYIDRSPEYYLQKAKEKSEQLYRIVEMIFKQEKYPEQLYRTCDGLFNLRRKTNEQTFNRACELAIENQNCSYRFIVNLIENKMTENHQRTKEQQLPDHHNIRGKEYYYQLTLKF